MQQKRTRKPKKKPLDPVKINIGMICLTVCPMFDPILVQEKDGKCNEGFPGQNLLEPDLVELPRAGWFHHFGFHQQLVHVHRVC